MSVLGVQPVRLVREFAFELSRSSYEFVATRICVVEPIVDGDEHRARLAKAVAESLDCGFGLTKSTLQVGFEVFEREAATEAGALLLSGPERGSHLDLNALRHRLGRCLFGDEVVRWTIRVAEFLQSSLRLRKLVALPGAIGVRVLQRPEVALALVQLRELLVELFDGGRVHGEPVTAHPNRVEKLSCCDRLFAHGRDGTRPQPSGGGGSKRLNHAVEKVAKRE